MKNVLLPLDEDAHSRARLSAAAQGISVSQLLRDALDDYLSRVVNHVTVYSKDWVTDEDWQAPYAAVRAFAPGLADKIVGLPNEGARLYRYEAQQLLGMPAIARLIVVRDE